MHLHHVYKFVYPFQPVSKPVIVQANFAPLKQVSSRNKHIFSFVFLFPLLQEISMINEYSQVLN